MSEALTVALIVLATLVVYFFVTKWAVTAGIRAARKDSRLEQRAAERWIRHRDADRKG